MTVVRVVNFTSYSWAKVRISDMVQQITGVSPLAEYNKPSSTPSVTGILTFATAGALAGLLSSPIACKICLVLEIFDHLF